MAYGREKKPIGDIDHSIGQDSFSNLVDQSQSRLQEQSPDTPNSARAEYSDPKDYSYPNKTNAIANKLRDREESVGDGKTRNNRDIGNQERAKFAGNTNKSLGGTMKDTPGSGNFFVRHKKGVAGWIIGLVMGGGMIGISTIVSGPAQMLQMMNFVHDTKEWINSAQTGARYMHSMSNMYQAFKNTNSKNIQNSRLNVATRRVVKAFEEKLLSRGLSFDSNAFGNSSKIVVDTVKDVGDGSKDLSSEKRKEMLSKRYGVDKSKFYLDANGKATFNLKDMSMKESRRLMYAINKSGKFDMISKISSRLMLAKIGKLSVLHPIRKIYQDKLNDLDEFIRRAVNNIENGTLELPEDLPNRKAAEDKAYEKEKDKLERDNKRLPESEKKTPAQIEEAAQKAAKEAGEIFEKALEARTNGIMQRSIVKVAEKIGSAALKEALKGIMKAAGKGGLAGLAVTALCMLQDALEEAGPYKMQSVITAIASVKSFMGTASQMMSAEDGITYEIIGNAANMYLGSEIPIKQVDEASGELVDTGKTEFQSAWSASPIVCELGEGNATDCAQGKGSTDALMPAGLRGVSDNSFTFFSDDINNMLSTLLTGGANPISGLCWVMDRVNEAMEFLTGWMTNWLTEWITKIPAISSLLGSLFQNLQSALYGKMLSSETLASMGPTGWGFVFMYGAKFGDNAQNRTFGRTLSDSENEQLSMQQREFLAWQESQKPLTARIFDPTNYNSTVNRIARAANLNTSSQDFMTQLGNVGRLFASTPKLLGMAFGKFGSSAYAEPYANSMTYDYGVPTIAFSTSEMEKITGGDSSMNFVENTEKILGSNGNNGIAADPDIRSKTKTCFGVTLTESGDISVDPNEDGAGWTYVDVVNNPLYGGSECATESLLRVRTYITDYLNVLSADCYENDGWAGGESASSCTEMGFGNSSTNSSSVTPGNCAANTNSLGTYDQAHDGNPDQPVSISLCEITSIKLSEPGFYTSNDPDIFRSTKSGGVIVSAEFSDQFQKMGEAAQAAGTNLTGKGIRSFEKQTYFYNCFINKNCNNGNEAARPGTSQHESGKAIDFSDGIGWLVQHAKEFGFCATVASENWHYAPKEGKTCYFGSN